MQKLWRTVVFLLFLLTLFACSSPDTEPPPPPPPPPNTAPVLSQPDTIALVHNTLAVPEEITVTFTATDAEDAETLLTVSTAASDANAVTLAQLSCNELGECTLGMSVQRTLPATVTVTLSVEDTRGSEVQKSFTITVAPEEINISTGAELKALLESSIPGASLKIANAEPILLDTQILLDKELTLWGSGQEQTLLDAQNLDRHFWIKPTAKVTMHDLTLIRGNAIDDGSTNQGEPLGGAIFNQGTLMLSKVRLINNRALSGGGLYNFETGQTVITDSIIGQEDAHNVATRSGGGVFNNAGRVEINSSQISFNEGILRGGGVFNFNDGELLVESSTFFNNFSEDGTALKNEEASAIIRDTIMENNVGTRLEGGAIVNLRGELELYDSVLKNNETLLGTGGAIYNGTSSTMLIDNTVLEGNKAARAGGAIYNEVGSGLLELRNGTKILNNSAAEHGGGIYNAGSLKLSSDCQIMTNTANTADASFHGGGIFNAGTFVDTPETTLNQVVTNNQPDNVFTPPPPLMAFYRALYQSRY